MKHPNLAAAALVELIRLSPVAELRNLEVECFDERVILRGTVGSFYHKQLAQELLRCALHGCELENAITVEYGVTDQRTET